MPGPTWVRCSTTSPGTGRRSPDCSEAAATTRHLLVIDDEPFVGQVIRMIFEKGPFKVSRAEDGASGLAFLRANPDIACVMVDINMPGLTGLDVMAAARADAAFASLPFLVLTAAGDQQHVARAQTLGALAFITKPFSPNKLYRQVCDLLGVDSTLPPAGDS